MNDQQIEELKVLAAQHHALDDKLDQLTRLSHPSEQQQFEEVTLKKRKLQLKDRMEAIRHQH